MSKSALGWLHKSSIAFFIWSCMMKEVQPNVILHECVAKFDWEVLARISGWSFLCQSGIFGLDDVGITH